MLHFVTSYIKQNKSRKQTLESGRTDWKSSLIVFRFIFLLLIQLSNIGMKDHYKTTVDSKVAISTSTVWILLSCKSLHAIIMLFISIQLWQEAPGCGELLKHGASL